ncbi:hypothetical protein GWI34_35880 [Actinomadura sp. DSM 109109]|nr:hypothetical protein [Actinomadura lepetitiana]
MSGDGLLILGLVALAVYTWAYWGRARRAAADMADAAHRRRSVLAPRRTAARQRDLLLSASVAALALALLLMAGSG